MNENDYVIFEIDECRLAVPSVLVEKVERAVQLTPVPDAPEPVIGVLSDSGDIVPVLGLRTRLGFVEREIHVNDRLLFSRLGRRRIALLTDSVSAVMEIAPDSGRAADEIWPGVRYLKSISGVEGDVVLMQDMDALLDPEQALRLDKALRNLKESVKGQPDG